MVYEQPFSLRLRLQEEVYRHYAPLLMGNLPGFVLLGKKQAILLRKVVEKHLCCRMLDEKRAGEVPKQISANFQ